jgi:N-sulfoglucosamine sulfohydrolase
LGQPTKLHAEDAAEASPSSVRPLNIVLFVTDDQSPTLGCYGDPIAKTPHVDRLAADGTRFTHAFATTASCSPSRAVILSGLHGHATGQYGLEHAQHHYRSFEQLVSLPVRLSKAGYLTARAGKYHVAPEKVYQFEVAVPGGHGPVALADNCRQIFVQHDRPFFLYFCTTDPHRSQHYGPPPHRANLFGNPPQDTFPGVDEVKYRPEDVPVPPFLPDNDITRAELAEYYQSQSRIDQSLGRLVSLLKETGQYDSTAIIFTSDHGMAFPGAKTTTYEPGLRVPLVVRSPLAQRRGVVNQALVSLVDLTPTILDAAGVSAPDGDFHGRSFWPILESENPKGWDQIFAAHNLHEATMYYPMRAVRDRRYKLIWNLAHPLSFPFASDLWDSPTWQHVFRQGPQAMYGVRTVNAYQHRPQFELYDLQEDPHEANNLADSAEHEQLLAEMKQRLQQFTANTKDPWHLKWNRE